MLREASTSGAPISLGWRLLWKRTWRVVLPTVACSAYAIVKRSTRAGQDRGQTGWRSCWNRKWRITWNESTNNVAGQGKGIVAIVTATSRGTSALRKRRSSSSCPRCAMRREPTVPELMTFLRGNLDVLQ